MDIDLETVTTRIECEVCHLFFLPKDITRNALGQRICLHCDCVDRDQPD